MWTSRLFGLALAVAGAALLGFIWSQLMDHSGQFLFIYQIGIPPAMALAFIGLLAFFFGAHLVIAPRSALKRRTPGSRHRG
jgi:hypothetical protein